MKTRPNGDARERLTPGAGAEAAHELEVEIEQIRARLAANEAERKELEAALRGLVSRRSTTVANYSSPAIADAPRVTAASPAAEKVALFRRLFAGRADVFPVRWENRKTAKSGYAPACEALLPQENGVLAATTAFGKTVVAAALIAKRGCNALVLVHRRELLAQWVERLRTFLEIDPKDIGVIGGGRRNATGVIDVALIQSLVRRGKVSDLVADYGHLVVDECRYLSAASFELVARRAKARYVLGLSATVARKDGHHPITFMQCGPVRHRVDARAHAAGARNCSPRHDPIDAFSIAAAFGRIGPSFHARGLCGHHAGRTA